MIIYKYHNASYIYNPYQKGGSMMEEKKLKKIKWETPELVKISQVGESTLCSGSDLTCVGGSQNIPV
jgi:hypothetical protein